MMEIKVQKKVQTEAPVSATLPEAGLDKAALADELSLENDLCVTNVYTSPDPENGSVMYYAQAHDTPEATNRDRAAIGEIQAEIFWRMEYEKPTVVFVEGKTLHPDSKDAKALRAFIREEIGVYFPDGINPFDLDDEQRIFFARYGATHIYEALNENVKTFPTTTPEIEQKVKIELAKLDPGSPTFLADRKKWIVDFREKKAMEMVSAYLSEHPGAHVGIVYGMAHQLTEYDFPSPAASPTIDRFDPSVPFTRTDDSGIALIKARGDKAKQEKIISEARIIRDVFLPELKDEVLLLKALNKVFVDVRNYTDKNELYSAMKHYCNEAGFKRLEEEIDKRFESNDIPFSYFEPDPQKIERFKSMSSDPFAPYLHNDMIVSEIDIATQTEYIRLATSIDPFSLDYIEDPRAISIAIDKLDTSSYEDAIKAGMEPAKVRKELYEFIKHSIIDLNNPILTGLLNPSERATLKALHKKVDDAYKNGTGPFQSLK